MLCLQVLNKHQAWRWSEVPRSMFCIKGHRVEGEIIFFPLVRIKQLFYLIVILFHGFKTVAKLHDLTLLICLLAKLNNIFLCNSHQKEKES